MLMEVDSELVRLSLDWWQWASINWPTLRPCEQPEECELACDDEPEELAKEEAEDAEDDVEEVEVDEFDLDGREWPPLVRPPPPLLLISLSGLDLLSSSDSSRWLLCCL